MSEMEPADDPLAQFATWFAEAVAAGCAQPDAMALATISASGHPDVRFVLLKSWDEQGFSFYTDRRSAKARDIAANHEAALAIHWYELHRQVRVAGDVEALSAAESMEYWMTRPHESRAAAIASVQSAPIPDRAHLVSVYKATLARFAGSEIPLPEQWGGYRIRPRWIEFWQGQPNRLHDRLRYTRRDDGWTVERLSP